jgi:hypothetical protein
MIAIWKLADAISNEKHCHERRGMLLPWHCDHHRKAMADSPPKPGANLPAESARTGAALEQEYPGWIRQFDVPSAAGLAAMTKSVATMTSPPRVSVILTGNGTALGTAAERAATIASLNRQIYPHWQLLMPLGAGKPDLPAAKVRALASSSFSAALAQAEGHFVTFVEAGDTLPPYALYAMIQAAAAKSGIFYSDEDEIETGATRCRPYFKPDWNYDLFLAQDYASRLAMVPAGLVRGLGRGMPSRRAVYDLILQVLAATPALAVHHLPQVLYHRHPRPKLSDTEVLLMRRSVEEHLQPVRRQLSQVRTRSCGPSPGGCRRHLRASRSSSPPATALNF